MTGLHAGYWGTSCAYAQKVLLYSSFLYWSLGTRLMTSHDITWHHMTSHDHHMTITWHHMTITWHHMTQHDMWLILCDQVLANYTCYTGQLEMSLFLRLTKWVCEFAGLYNHSSWPYTVCQHCPGSKANYITWPVTSQDMYCLPVPCARDTTGYQQL